MLQTQTGDFVVAADSLARALAPYERWGSENGKAEVFNSLGELALAKGDSAGALRYHGMALAIAEDKEIMREEARAREGIGQVHRARGRRAEADGEFRSAYVIYDKLESPHAARLAELIAQSGS